VTIPKLKLWDVGDKGLEIRPIMKLISEFHDYLGPVPRVGEFYSRDSLDSRTTSYWKVIGVLHRHVTDVQVFLKLVETVVRSEPDTKTPLIVREWM